VGLDACHKLILRRKRNDQEGKNTKFGEGEWQEKDGIW